MSPARLMAGRTALITGAGAGIGRASALRLAEEGARIVVADWDGDRAKETAALVDEAGGEALAVASDVTDEAGWQALAEASVARFGGVDVLFNNAGGGSGRDGPVTEMDLDEFWRAIRVDLFGTVLGCRTIIPLMARGGRGSIINIASLRAVIGTTGQDAYTAAKGGVLALSRAMAVEWAPRNIRVNVMAPGVVMTDRVAALIPPDSPIFRKSLLGPLDPGDVANLVLYLASDQSRGVTGTVMRLDGGASAH